MAELSVQGQPKKKRSHLAQQSNNFYSPPPRFNIQTTTNNGTTVFAKVAYHIELTYRLLLYSSLNKQSNNSRGSLTMT